jgi:hypothetical protein
MTSILYSPEITKKKEKIKIEKPKVEKEKKNSKKRIEIETPNLPTNQPTSGYIKKKKNAKIIESILPETVIIPPVKNVNIILHLKCTIREIDEYIHKSNWKYQHISYDPSIPTDIIAYENNSVLRNFGDYTSCNTNLDSLENPLLDETKTQESKQIMNNSNTSTPILCYKCNQHLSSCNDTYISSVENKETENKNKKEEEELEEIEIQKIKELKISFYKNELSEKKTDCFWCSYPYDNEPCYILQYGYNQDIYGHGSFCSPECAVAFLFGKQMNWDDSAKTESYQLMNYYYGKPNDYEKSIKPALSPYYFLDKYYGNMTIQEYRKLTKSQHHMLIVEKPVTRILPEIHEDNDFLTVGNNYANSGKYKVKKKSEKPTTQNRNNILREQFGLGSISRD